MTRLTIDTETTGLLRRDLPLTAPEQPHLAALGAMLTDDTTGRVLAMLDVLIQPDGWEMPAEAAAINGLTTDRLRAEGVPIHSALGILALLAFRAGEVVAHHAAFEQSILRITAARADDRAVAFAFESREWRCTSEMGARLFPHLPLSAHGKGPRLSTLHTLLFGYPHRDAHTALGDVEATHRVFRVLNGLASVASVVSGPITGGAASAATVAPDRGGFTASLAGAAPAAPSTPANFPEAQYPPMRCDGQPVTAPHVRA